MVPTHNLQGVFVAIPTGDRSQKALGVAKAWRAKDIEVVAYCWDDETHELLKEVTPYLYRGERKSFAELHNLMAKHTTGWDCMICGADDLYPIDVSRLEDTYKRFPDKILWANDNICRNHITHPIITRQWYDSHKEIFDERFVHNFCDIDLFVQASQRGEIIRCFGIIFDHQHYLKTGEALDKIHKIAKDSFAEDEKRFYDKYKEKSTALGFVPTYYNQEVLTAWTS